VARSPTTHVIDGIEYWGAANLEDEFGIYEETVRKRLQAGWSARQAVGLDPPEEIKRIGKSYELSSQIFKSEFEMAEMFDLASNHGQATDVICISIRLNSGWLRLVAGAGFVQGPTLTKYV